MIRGRERIIGLMRRGEGRMGFEVKIHRIAAEGNAVLTERTDAVVFGELRVQFWSAGSSRYTPAESPCGGTTSTSSTSSRDRPRHHGDGVPLAARDDVAGRRTRCGGQGTNDIVPATRHWRDMAKASRVQPINEGVASIKFR